MVLQLTAISVIGVTLFGCTSGQPTPNQTVVEAPSPSTTPVATQTPGFVNDEQAAIEIALKTWIPVYGKQTIDDEKPYVADLKDGVWHVHGSLPKNWIGGVAEAWISQKDGRVIRFIHSK